MKKTHGNILIILLIFFTLTLNADNEYCTYSIKSSKSSVVVNEPLYITFHTRQKKHSEVMFFDLLPVKSDSYDAILLHGKRHEFNYHDAEKTFTFLVFAKKSGNIKVSFDFSIRRASDDAVAQAYVGSRDNVKSIPTIKVDIAKSSVNLSVSKLEADTNAIGNFNLNMHLDKNSSDSYDAINVTYYLSGTGYIDENYRPLKEIKGTSIFEGFSEKEPLAVKNGFIYKKEFKYAIIAKEDFTIKPAELKLFNTEKNRYEIKSTPQKDVKITPLDIKTLLDEIELPKAANFEKYISYIYNILIFIAGFLTALLYKSMTKKRVKTKKENCCEYIRKSTTAQEALKALIPMMNRDDIRDEIQRLESIAYSNKEVSAFKEIKADIIKKLSN